MQLAQSAGHAELGSTGVQERQVGVGADPDSPSHGVGDHVEEPRVHHRLAQPLKLELFQVRELFDQPCEDVEIHERGRTVGRTILSELDRAHLTTQGALADRLDLEKAGQGKHGGILLGTTGQSEEKHAELERTVEPPEDGQGWDQRRGHDHFQDVPGSKRGPLEPAQAEARREHDPQGQGDHDPSWLTRRTYPQGQDQRDHQA